MQITFTTAVLERCEVNKKELKQARLKQDAAKHHSFVSCEAPHQSWQVQRPFTNGMQHTITNTHKQHTIADMLGQYRFVSFGLVTTGGTHKTMREDCFSDVAFKSMSPWKWMSAQMLPRSRASESTMSSSCTSRSSNSACPALAAASGVRGWKQWFPAGTRAWLTPPASHLFSVQAAHLRQPLLLQKQSLPGFSVYFWAEIVQASHPHRLSRADHRRQASLFGPAHTPLMDVFLQPGLEDVHPMRS